MGLRGLLARVMVMGKMGLRDFATRKVLGVGRMGLRDMSRQKGPGCVLSLEAKWVSCQEGPGCGQNGVNVHAPPEGSWV